MKTEINFKDRIPEFLLTEIKMDTSFYREFRSWWIRWTSWKLAWFSERVVVIEAYSKMEKELGVKLFDRSSRKVELHIAGKWWLHAEKIVEAEMESRDAIRNAVEMENGVLMVGILPDATNYQLTDASVFQWRVSPDAVIKALDNDTLELSRIFVNVDANLLLSGNRLMIR